jgi:hypothetical protein|nr:MAG TPA: hypothetical protein [Caudoviricetes sp.]
MIYKFTKKEMEALRNLSIPFDPFSDLSEDEELLLLDIVDDAASRIGYDTPEGDLYTDILDSMAKQAK